MLEREPPLTALELEALEERLELRLPPLLRDLYQISAELALYWNIRAEAWAAAGYDPDVVEWGQFALCPAQKLGEREWFEELLQITEAGAGNGWFLDRTVDGDPREVIWGDHDSADPLGESSPSVDELFSDLLDDHLCRNPDLGELVRGFLVSGTLPPPPR